MITVRVKACPHCASKRFAKKGFYYHRRLKVYRRRFRCKVCLRSFSTQTLSPTFRQKRPDLNTAILKLLISGVPQRGIARFLKCSRTTVDRKFVWLYQNRELQSSQISRDVIYIDEMLSIEHTKLKPLTIPIAVSSEYEILSTQVAKIPARGLLAKIARAKYGAEVNERELALRNLFFDLRERLKEPPKIIRSDGDPSYARLVKEFFPSSRHEVFLSKNEDVKSRELLFLSRKKREFDPLFPVNQRCAKLRADIRRLARRSWCTTKIAINLSFHLELYRCYQNA